MKRFAISFVTAGLFLASAAYSSAQTVPAEKEGRIQQRKENQQKRIGEGVENGSLTPKETARLERQQARLNHEIRHDRKVNGGNLTNKEKAQINRQQNHLSKNIDKKKHDGPNQ
jgi:hypothetical protein